MAGGMNMREKWRLTPSGTTRIAHGSITVLTLGTTMPMRARHPSPSRNAAIAFAPSCRVACGVYTTSRCVSQRCRLG